MQFINYDPSQLINCINVCRLLQTINDVALGATQAGLSKYLNRRYGELISFNFVSVKKSACLIIFLEFILFCLGIENKNDVGETEKKNNLPKKIRLRSILFINIRPSQGIQVSTCHIILHSLSRSYIYIKNFYCSEKFT